MLVTTRMLLLKTTEKEKRDKLQVVKYAAENGNRAAERKFEMREKLVRDWRKGDSYCNEEIKES